MKNSAIKQENIVQLSRKIVWKKSANKQQNSANKHAEHLSRYFNPTLDGLKMGQK